MAYGHRRRGDCSDIETIVAPGEGTRAEILQRIDAITPTGKTPLTNAVEQAATALAYTDAPATVVLISDGLESCERDPCAVSEALERAGVGFTAHVVGFGLGDEDASALSCIAENTGGQYLSARNADEPGEALSAVGSAVAAAPEPEPDPEVTIDSPDSTLAGAAFEVSWTGTVHSRDFVTIVSMGADEGEVGDYFRVGDKSRNDMEAPETSGFYEVRYVLNEGRRVMANTQIEVLAADAPLEQGARLSAPDTAAPGESIAVDWSVETESDDQRLTVAGADQAIFTWVTAVRLEGRSPVEITLPEEPGTYELRLLDVTEQEVLARRMIRVD